MRKFKGFRAFTMIEMLVVIGIIIVLVSLIMPVIGAARRSARNAVCKGNLKQLHVAFTSFVKENSFVPGNYSSATNGIWKEEPAGVFTFVPFVPAGYQLLYHGWITWGNYMINTNFERSAPPTVSAYPWWGKKGLESIQRGPFFSYTGSSIGIYLCPEFALSSVSGSKAPDGRKFDDSNPRVRSYVMNMRMEEFNNEDAYPPKINWEMFNSASQRLLFTESHTRASDKLDKQKVCNVGFLENDEQGIDGLLDPTVVGGRPNEVIGALHNGKANAVFVDGHVQELTYKDTTNACAGVM